MIGVIRNKQVGEVAWVWWEKQVIIMTKGSTSKCQGLVNNFQVIPFVLLKFAEQYLATAVNLEQRDDSLSYLCCCCKA